MEGRIVGPDRVSMSVQARRRAPGLRQTLEQPLAAGPAGHRAGRTTRPSRRLLALVEQAGGAWVDEEAGTVPARDRWGRYVRRDGIPLARSADRQRPDQAAARRSCAHVSVHAVR